MQHFETQILRILGIGPINSECPKWKLEFHTSCVPCNSQQVETLSNSNSFKVLTIMLLNKELIKNYKEGQKNESKLGKNKF